MLQLYKWENVNNSVPPDENLVICTNTKAMTIGYILDGQWYTGDDYPIEVKYWIPAPKPEVEP